ncbi:permease for cytosine/purines, uracil, thiamine, allantoin-domain-containing protein [Fennellomyces sp. T-0311]|nr:permease for cytosine/purines, uracil, thiamine, allantoin-domain-containing protein [Fennellomyces sp. T-0311]
MSYTGDRKEQRTINTDTGSTTALISEKRWLSVPKVEQQGITPTPEDGRPHTRITDNFTLWFTVNTNSICLSFGIIGMRLYHISFWEGFTCIVIANALSAIPGAIFTTFGPRYGFRQIVIARYSFGLIPTSILSAVNTFAFLGWGVVDVILGAQLLNEVQPSGQDSFPLWAATLIIVGVTLAVTIFGYNFVHFFERWSWIPLWIIFFILFGMSVHHIDFSTLTSSSDVGDVLSFFSLIASAFPIWVQCASDFSSKQPSTFSRPLVALLAYFGAIIPVIVLETLGLAIAVGISQPNENPTWYYGYENNSVGGLVSAVLAPLSWFGKLLLLLLAFGMIVHIVPNNYSVALMMQATVPGFYRIPLWVFSIFVAIVIAVASIAGAEYLATILQSLLPLQMYYICPYATIVMLEHYVFRRGQYRIESWNSLKELPVGLAAVASTVVSYGVALLGARQSWFVGPIAKKISEHGGEIGLWISLVVAACSYLVFRYIERRIFGR